MNMNTNTDTDMDTEQSVTTTITNQFPGYYKCGHCALHFKTLARFRSHEATCLSLKQIRARATFAPTSEHATTTDLLALVQQLALRLETVEHELSVVKKEQQKQQKQQQQQNKNQIHRGNLLQWLNDQTSALRPALLPKPFAEWLPTIPAIGRDHLELVFQHGFIDGMCAIIASMAATHTHFPTRCPIPIPICAYDEAPSTLFVYVSECTNDNECMDKRQFWRLITHAEFEQFINRMQKLLMNEFVCWQQAHVAQLHDPDFAEKYDANLLKVTGSGKAKSGGCSNRDMLMTRLKPKVYAAIKRSANAVTGEQMIQVSDNA